MDSREAVHEPLRGHETVIFCVAISGDGTRIVSGWRDGTVRVWDMDSGEAVHEPPAAMRMESTVWL